MPMKNTRGGLALGGALAKANSITGTMKTTELTSPRTAKTFPFWCGEKRAICCFMERRLLAPTTDIRGPQSVRPHASREKRNDVRHRVREHRREELAGRDVRETQDQSEHAHGHGSERPLVEVV